MLYKNGHFIKWNSKIWTIYKKRNKVFDTCTLQLTGCLDEGHMLQSKNFTGNVQN